jgi:hypothetical protein
LPTGFCGEAAEGGIIFALLGISQTGESVILGCTPTNAVTWVYLEIDVIAVVPA